MPLQQTASYDPLTAMIRIQKSDIFEMIMSLQGIIDSWKMQDLAEEAKSALGETFIEEVTGLYRKLYTCCYLTELAVDYPDRNNVEGFIEYVRALPLNEFLFYLLGRWFPLEEIPPDVTKADIQNLIDNHEESEELRQLYPNVSWIDNLKSFRESICRTWDDYWRNFFSGRVADLEEPRTESIREKQEYLEQHGGTELYKQVTGHDKLPDPIPAGMPITNIEFIPLCNTPRHVFVFYGYGAAQVLYDCSITRDHQRKVDDYRENSLIALKALADENRLKILKMISQNERMINGKKMAQKLELSPSVVSRHLGQLKHAGLIEEHTVDKRNITYTFQFSRLRALSKDLEAYIRD